jgi:histidine phosphotransferase ChpT
MNDPNIAMLELLASKICHDLISPIGAVNNGVEFMQDMGPNAGPEAAELIAFSAQQASAKLQAFRLAYGAGGADSIIKLSDVHKAIQQIVGAEKKITQNWEPQTTLPLSPNKGFCKILTCVLLLAMEGLPKGGKLLVTADGDAVIVRAEGTDAGLRGHAEAALKLDIAFEKVEPKDVHAAMTGLMAKHYGFKVAMSAPAEFRITAA